jgi:hypothetical protein
MEVLLATVGITVISSMYSKLTKETFVPTYLDSEEYYKQNVNAEARAETNRFDPPEHAAYGGKLQTGYNNPYANNDPSWLSTAYPLDNGWLDVTQPEFIEKNSLYNTEKINGIPLKDYYDTYTKDVLAKGNWFLNKDMPEDTKQYRTDSAVQQRMEEITGLRQQRDRNDLGVPTRKETRNLFTPEEQTTTYGYQYGISGKNGPGLAITRQKEFEDLKKTIKFKTNEQPFEKIQVGPGLSIGTAVPAAGGFQQYTRIVPDNISDYSANQLPGMVAGGKWAFSNAPTSQQPVVSNRPQKFYSLCQYGPVAGKSTVTAPMTIPDYAVTLKNQNRTVINYGYGAPLQALDNFLK